MVLLSRSSCVHWSFSISPILAPVSLRVWSSVAVLGLADAIRLSISCSVGMKGIVLSRLYCGLVHVLAMYFTYPE